eukprot:g8925.t2
MVMSLYFDQSSFCFWRLDGLRQCNKAEQVESTRKRQHEVLKAERPEGLSRHGDMVRIVGDGDWCHDSLGCFPALPVLEASWARRLAPVLSKTASYYELLWTLWKCSQGVHVNKMYMPYVLWLLFATFVIQPKVSLWARTMKARIPILEAQVFGASRAKHTSEAGAQAFGIGPFPRVRQVKKVKVGGKAWQMATTGTWRTPNSDLGALTRKKDVAWFDSSAFGRSQSSAPRGPSPTFLCKDGHASFFSKWHQLTIDIGTRRC